MDNSVAYNLRNLKTWERLLYMVLFGIIIAIMDMVLLAVVLLQVVLTLITGSQNDRARKFGGDLGLYACQIYHFLTYYSETRPFPFSDWPSVEKTGESSHLETPKPAKQTVKRVKKTENEAI